MRQDRQRYIPSNSTELKDEESGAVCYTYPMGATGRVGVIGYSGKRTNSDFHYAYSSMTLADAQVTRYFQNCRRVAADRKAMKAERAAQLKDFKTALKVDDIMVSTWGYDQTNVDFYQVIAVSPTGKSVTIREIAKHKKADAEWMQGHATPLKDHFTGEPMVKRVGVNNSVSIESPFATAWKWDGRPERYSEYA